MLKKHSHNSDADAPDVRADEPDRANERFTEGLRRVLSAPKTSRRKRKRRIQSK